MLAVDERSIGCDGWHGNRTARTALALASFWMLGNVRCASNAGTDGAGPGASATITAGSEAASTNSSNASTLTGQGGMASSVGGGGAMAGSAGAGAVAATGAGAVGGMAGSATHTGGSAGSGGFGGAASGGSSSSGGSMQGGSGGSAGSAGTGGSIEGPPSGSYEFGFMPTTAASLDASLAYQTFRMSYVEDCGDGAHRVRWDNPDQTVSEGIAYGMLLAVSNDDREVFDGLLSYYEANLDPNGLMHWKREGCEGSQPDANSNNAATDADLDAAMALIMAECRWGEPSYGARADALSDAILDHATSVSADVNLLHPGDVFGGSDCLNASYFAPAYYRVFAERSASEQDRQVWEKLASDSYVLIERMRHAVTGFVPNWADETGSTSESGPSGCEWYEDAHIFGSDAIRTPWRIAVDYLWYGTPEAKLWLDRVTEFVAEVGIENVGRKFELDGTPFGDFDHSIISVGAFASAAMAYDQATADEFAAEATSVMDHDYFPDSLRGLYLLVLTGRFTLCGGT